MLTYRSNNMFVINAAVIADRQPKEGSGGRKGAKRGASLGKEQSS
jgi:hypothetical protein